MISALLILFFDSEGQKEACMSNENNSVKLKVEHLSKTYEGKQALADVNFEIYDGEFLSILGPSGCGKTTLLRILIGLLKPDTGRILKNGMDITSLRPADREIGIVFQNYALFENMTVFENVEYAMKLRKDFKAQAKERTEAMLKNMNLLEHANKKPAELSGGQQQRVAIARTLVLNPDIILFDEPMSALDVETRLMLRRELKDIQKRYGTTMIYVTHDQEEAFALSDRVMVMQEAKVVQIDTPQEIVDHPANDYVQSFVNDNIQLKLDSLIKFAR